MAICFDLTKEQEQLRKTVRNFAEKEIAPKAEELDEKEEFSYELTKQMADLGFFGMIVPEEYGGFGLDYLSYIIVVEELARIDASQAATVAAGNSLGISPIYYFGNEEQKKFWLPKLCAGEMLAAFGLTEADAGSDAGNSKTTAVLDGNEWVINGSKIFITNGANDMTGVIIVQAKTGRMSDGKPEMSCILVSADVNGLTKKAMHKKMVWRSSNTAELYFTDCRVPKENLLGKRGDGFKQMLKTLDGGRLSIGAMGLGGAQGALELGLKYAQERKQFGKAIGEFQSTAFKLADCSMQVEAARNLLYKACWLADNTRPYGKESAMAKLYCSEVMRLCVWHSQQIHGGYGLMKEYAIERFYRDQRLLEVGEGTSEIQRIVIARHLGLGKII
jgi:short/branched chain acyl-CoA dehydrogenase